MTLADGGCDWTAGILACNVAFFSGVQLRRYQIARAFSCFALMQARMPAVQSHPPSAKLENNDKRTTNNEPRTTNHQLTCKNFSLSPFTS